jgi:small neutral amino acid transporter SnatA (MarC family)
MNPIANTPVFPGLTAEDDPDARRKIAVKALIVNSLSL